MEQKRYLSYLLRIWRVGPEADDWRAMLENASTGERHGFANPHILYAYIQAQAEELEYSPAQQPAVVKR